MTPPFGNSRRVRSPQDGPAEQLGRILARHRDTPFSRPPTAQGRAAMTSLAARLDAHGGPLVIDAGCGTGDSARQLAQAQPDALVVGIDKSRHRLSREREGPAPSNLLLLRADLLDVYPLMRTAGIAPAAQYLLYPNPWPKPKHLMRRWHGSPIFPDLLQLGGRIELRTNWRIYAEEFVIGLHAYGLGAVVETFVPSQPYLTPFEKKYAVSGHDFARVVVEV